MTYIVINNITVNYGNKTKQTACNLVNFRLIGQLQLIVTGGLSRFYKRQDPRLQGRAPGFRRGGVTG